MKCIEGIYLGYTIGNDRDQMWCKIWTILVGNAHDFFRRYSIRIANGINFERGMNSSRSIFWNDSTTLTLSVDLVRIREPSSTNHDVSISARDLIWIVFSDILGKLSEYICSVRNYYESLRIFWRRKKVLFDFRSSLERYISTILSLVLRARLEKWCAHSKRKVVTTQVHW